MLYTICIPVYNGEHTISESILSAINQTYIGEYNILIVDNNSSDKTVEISKSFHDKRIRVIKPLGFF